MTQPRRTAGNLHQEDVVWDSHRGSVEITYLRTNTPDADLPQRSGLFSMGKENLSQLADEAEQELTRTGEATGVAFSIVPQENNLAFITKFQLRASSHRIEHGGPVLYKLTKNNTSREGEDD